MTGSGLFEKARMAEQKSKEAQEKEEQILGEYINIINSNGKVTEGEKLPENTPDIEAGTEVALEDGWGTETVKYIRTADGTEVTELGKVSTVYAVSVGNGETVPVPNEFYYVGGNLTSGVVISDNKADKNKYAKDDNGAVGIDLEGNQFVWIPCEPSNYKKCTVWNGTTQTGTTLQNSNWDTTVDQAGLIQTEKYGGFYVARYESGLDLSKAHTAATANTSNYHDSETSKPQSKAGLIPCNWVSWNTSKERAEEMYNNNYVHSALITGAQWDVMINIINAKTGASLTDSQWGNYDNTSITYIGSGATYDTSTSKLGTFTGTSGTTNYEI